MYKGAKSMKVVQSNGRLFFGYMVTVLLPYLDMKSSWLLDFVNKGSWFKITKLSVRRYLDLRDKVYSHDEFMEHFGEYREGHNLWKLNNGLISPRSWE
ncbi:hypothetical protein N7453_003157 [Penicillium expansum]|nr:hypothetical protein N7453_003157 [Penicillium expansum]